MVVVDYVRVRVSRKEEVERGTTPVGSREEAVTDVD